MVSEMIARNSVLLQKSSPGLLFGAGVVGVVGGAVLACRATLKMDEVLDEGKAKLAKVRAFENPVYDEGDRRKDIALVQFQTGVKVVKLYLPAFVVGGLAIACLTRSHVILTKRNAGLTAAYGALDRAYKEYRARVVEKYGVEQDEHFRYGTEQVQVIDAETNKKKTITRVAKGEPSLYARFFDESCPSWSRDPEVNRFWLQCQQNHCNDLLRAKGIVFLNEAYEAIGLKRSTPGAVVGWVRTRDGSTDNHVDFGIFKGENEQVRDFVNGYEGSILLDFNVDGVVYDLLDDPPEELAWQLGQ